MGLLIIGFGVAAVIVGVLVTTGALSWFGRLPGDIRIETARSRIFIPITSVILVSVVLTLLLSMIHRC
ncbi:MAG: DUF2905 family protein [Nitriliruptorales bacterium]|nr:DUF2905 family protein [Nitriliruptorales bacterium]